MSATVTTTNSTSLFSPKQSSLNNPAICFSGLTFRKKLGSAKFCVYLVHNNLDKTDYALKAFPENDDTLSKYYQNETRFSHLVHPNICRILAGIRQQSVNCGSEVHKYSFLVTEYAPYGNFCEFFQKRQVQLSEKLVRTYFHQLISGLEYLHGKGVGHLDIKCENLLLGNNFELKITDFDLSQYFGEKKAKSKGSLGSRAPEITDNNCEDLAKADVYSAGIVLFILKSGGIQPYSEQEKFQGIDLFQLMWQDRTKFWKIHDSIQRTGMYSDTFRKLFDIMTQKEPAKRATITDIKKSEWFNGPILSENQVKTEMRYFFMA